MVRAHFKGVNTSTKRLADGTVRRYYYHRATGQSLRGKPGSPDFIADYAAAEKLLMDRHAGTLTGLIRDYCLSMKFERLANSTKTEYGRMLTKIEAKFGDMPIAALEVPRVRRHFMEWHEQTARQSGAREADNRMSVLSAVLTWAKRQARIGDNQVAGFERLHSADRSEMIWLPEHLSSFEAVAPEEVRRAMVLALHTGLRQGAMLRLTWSNLEYGADGRLWIKPAKVPGAKRTPSAIPCTQTLRTELESLARTDAVILTTKTGLAWKARHFKSEWKKVADAAGIENLHFHDLRGTAITMLSEAGCTPQQVASITGHSMKSITTILDRYLARTRVLAGEAIDLLENARRTKFANQLQTGDASTEKGPAK